jgi:O-antigen/teichoic acid export membrane protein/glycosyltransferase involved in cell wall biosynthesis
LFWLSLGVSVVLYGVLFFAAPLIAAYYHAPELTVLARFVFLGFVVSSLSTMPLAYMFRHLMVRQRAMGALSALIVSGFVGIVMAVQGYAYWGLAVQSVVYIAVTCVIYWCLVPVKPLWRIDLRPLRGVMGFSSKMMLTNVANIVNQNLLMLVLGRFYPKHEVGLYQQANKWNMMGSGTLSGMIQGVAQPTLSQLRCRVGTDNLPDGCRVGTDNLPDGCRRLRVFRKMLRFAAFVSFPAMWGLALIAPELIHIAIGEKWAESVPLLQILCVSGAFAPLIARYAGVATSAGRSGVYLRNTLLRGGAQLVCALVLYRQGIVAMLAGYTVLSAAWLPVWHCSVKGLLRLRFVDALRDVLPYVCVSVLAVLAARAVCLTAVSGITNYELRITSALLIKVGVAAGVYALVLWRLNSTIFMEVMSYLHLTRGGGDCPPNPAPPKISVLMLTYNHAAYIDEAIESVLRQRCPYPYELVIADDCSTDGTSERCAAWQAKYPDRIVYHRNAANVGLARNFYEAYGRLRGAYVAICEGDDYWLSRHKLRRQVGWLERHPDYVCCYHRVLNYVQETGEKSFSNGGRFGKRNVSLLDLAACNYITNVSAVFRRAGAEPLPEWFLSTPTYDYALHLLNAERGMSHFMSLPMAVYRHHQGAAWSTASARKAAELSAGVRRLLIDYFAAKGREDVCAALQPLYQNAMSRLSSSDKLSLSPRHRNPLMRIISNFVPIFALRNV